MDGMVASFCDGGCGVAGEVLVTPTIDLYLEDGNGHFGDGSYGLAIDPLWAEPNTFPMISADIRIAQALDGSFSFAFSAEAPGAASASQFADWVANRVEWFFNTAATWPSGKPRRYSLNFRGFDAPDCSVRCARHPLDRFGPENASPFMANGRAEIAAWVVGKWEAVKAELVARGLPMPDRLFTNIEKMGDVHGASVGSGSDLWSWAMADARAGTELIDGVRTLNQWAALRTTTIDGAAYPAFPVSGQTNPRHPENWDIAQRTIAAVQTAYMHTLAENLYAPFRAVFGDKPCAEWQLVVNSRSSPSIFRPEQFNYDLDGFCPHGFGSVPVCYGGPADVRGDGSAPNTDPRWEFQSNWLAYYGIAGAVTEAKMIEAGRRSTLSIVGSAIRLGDPKTADVVPSISTHYNTDQAAAALLLGRLVAEAAYARSRAVWLYQPVYASSATQRAATLALVREANSRIASGDLSE